VVDRFRALLACPGCAGELSDAWTCRSCRTSFDASDSIPNLRLPTVGATETVRLFYEAAPFPGYPPRDTLHALRARAERNPFVRLLDRSIPEDARIVEIGCGTGQMSLYLARGDRTVIAADLSRAALRLGAQAANRFGVGGAQFIETDLQRPALKPGAFDVVYSAGVLHHTPDPRKSFVKLVHLARPGGVLVIGLYNALARIPSRLRRVTARVSGLRWIPFDPVLRARDGDTARRAAWLRDQYQHPEEHCHTVGEVRRWFYENEVEPLRTYPSTLFGDDPDDLFVAADDDWAFESVLAQMSWMMSLGREGGLFFAIGRRHECA